MEAGGHALGHADHGDGRVVENGTVVVHNDKILSVGTGGAPAGATVIDGKGLTVYPGFIDAYSTSGLKLPDALPNGPNPPDTLNTAPATMWKGNRKNSGFLPEERAWMTSLLDEIGLVDVFRTLNPHAEQYTWWSNRGQARAKNVGWRIDYHLATPGIAAKARSEHIYLEQRFSDHAPLVIDYDFDL